MKNKRSAFTFVELIIFISFISLLIISFGKVMSSTIKTEKETALSFYALAELEHCIEKDLSITKHKEKNAYDLFTIEINHTGGHWKEYVVRFSNSDKVYRYEIFNP